MPFLVIYYHRYVWTDLLGVAHPRTFVAIKRPDGSIENLVLEGHYTPGFDMDRAVEARLLELGREP